ncbi:MAG TPA: AMIN domain-containing protein [Polyangiales bacterium]
MRGPLVPTLLLACLGSFAPLEAPGPNVARADGYGGVCPGKSNVPDGIAAQPGSAALVTWPGFQLLANGGSRVFIQTSVAVSPSLKRDGSHLVVSLPGVSLPPGNVRRPLDTSFFNTPVKSVRVKPHKGGKGGGASVEIELRGGAASVAPDMRSEKASNGYFFVYVDFPAGQYR